ncbi:MAG: phosphatidylinositol-3,5-bisphosphate 5-phosphatase [Chrysothrix sp. TS-e1954]|nr:MAG: phosphatidylinositol-3,5-bisphosphate 5-phosphatase [Chrysothrix sp. TS-e1954]
MAKEKTSEAMSSTHRLHEKAEASARSAHRLQSKRIPDNEIQDFDLQRMHKFSLYETRNRFYLVGGDIADAHFRMLKIDRTAPPDTLSIVEDHTTYTKSEMDRVLSAIDDGNRSIGGMRLKCNAWGLLGFIRFTEHYYMLIVTKRQQVATLGGHYIYQVDGTELVPICTGSSANSRNNRNAEESRFLAILGVLDLHRSFYFSYSYDVTRSLQHNIIRRRHGLALGLSGNDHRDYNDMFIWNHHLLGPALDNLEHPYDWCLPIIHGFVDQSSVNVFGRNLYITIIARRSRFFAGARFLKRGANDMGYVANDVETEQIVADMLVTSFNMNIAPYLKKPNYTSFVQHRGSIPLYWTQDNSGVSPKPAIDVSLIDPFYGTAARHFDDLFQRYSAPIYVLNLIKARERTPRESKLLVEYQNAIKYLNQSLPEGKKILYRAYDMSRAAKTRGQDVIGTLEDIAGDIIKTTSIFANEGESSESSSVQNGVVRSNCIDCLDRTNAAQFVIGKRALAIQLQALGVTTDPSLNYDSDASNLFAHMFNDHGDTLASQYGGSHLVNTTDSYRKINNWQSHSRDMLESFKRYYHNSFLDNQRQEAYNLFLGNYVYASGQPMLWDLQNDYYLHHTAPQNKLQRRNYINWYTPAFLEPNILPPVPSPGTMASSKLTQDWWYEYYRPNHISSLMRIFAYKMNSTERYLPKALPSNFDMSPFSVRKGSQDSDAIDQTPGSKEAVIADANSREVLNPLSATSPPQHTSKRITSLQKWLNPQPRDGAQSESNNETPASKRQTASHRHQATSSTISLTEFKSPTFAPPSADKSKINQWTLEQHCNNSLNPTVSDSEVTSYEAYLDLPLKIADTTLDEDTGLTETTEYEDFIASGRGEANSASGDETNEFKRWLEPIEDPLTVKGGDLQKKRYHAYEKWLKGKSLFKQGKLDTEFKSAG